MQTGIWDKHGKEIIELRRQGYTLEQIGQRFGRTRERIRALLKKRIGTTKVPMANQEQVIRMLSTGSNIFQNYRREGLLTPIKINHFVYYPDREIDKARLLLSKYCKGCGKSIPRTFTWCPECLAERRREYQRQYYKKKD